jgi:inner membrane protein
MLSLYVGYALSSMVRGLIMLCVFLILYGLLYLILRLEDYALLAGTLAGFVMLTVTMFATLRVNWSGDDRRQFVE